MYNYLLISIFAVLGIYILLNFKKILKSEESAPQAEEVVEEPAKLLTDSVGSIEQVKEVKAKVVKKTVKKKVKKKTPRRRDL